MNDAAPPPDQVWNFDEKAGDTRDDPRFSLGIETYPGRVLGATHEGDSIQLLPRLRSEWSSIVAHYRRIGLKHTHHVIWDTSYEVTYAYPNHTLSTFFFGEQAHAVRENKRFYTIVQRMNSKNACMRLCDELTIPTPHTHCFARMPEKPIEMFIDFPLYVKADTSVSGRGVVRCKDRAALTHVLSRISPMVPFQIQEEVRNVVAFINVQYRVRNGMLTRSMVTEQLLDGNTHKGNQYPTTFVPWKYTDPLAKYMHVRGMEDVFAFDLAIDTEGAYRMLECNPRYNGSSYPSAVAHKLGIHSWSAYSFETRFRSLGDIELGALEYDCAKKSGVVLVNWGAVQQGVLGVLLAGTPCQQHELALKLRDMLS